MAVADASPLQALNVLLNYYLFCSVLFANTTQKCHTCRFSSGDLSSECDEVDPNDPTAVTRPPPLQQQPLPQASTVGGPPAHPPPPAPTGGPPPGNAPDLSLSFGKGPPRGVSAPASPAKSRESLLQRVQSLTGAARDQGASIIGAAVSSATRPSFNKDKCFTLLVLDDQNTDWSKYFRGKRLHGDYDIRVEQAEFREIGLTANADGGTQVSMAVYRNNTKVIVIYIFHTIQSIIIRHSGPKALESTLHAHCT